MKLRSIINQGKHVLCSDKGMSIDFMQQNTLVNPNSLAYFQAAAYGYLGRIRYLLDNGFATLTERDQHGLTAFHIACSRGYWLVVKEFLERGIDPNITDSNGQTGLHYAVFHGYRSVLKLLLAFKANKEAIDHQGRTPLMFACYYNRIVFIQLLANAGADINATDQHGNSGLQYAVINRYHEAISVIFKYSVEVNHANAEAITALHLAVALGDLVVVKGLLKHGADCYCIDDQKFTPLIYAAIQNESEIISALLENNKTTQYQDDNGYTALHHAVEANSIKAAETLIAHNPDLCTMQTKKLLETPLHLAVKLKHIRIIKLILEQEVKTANIVNKDNDTAVDLAYQSDEAEIKVLFKIPTETQQSVLFEFRQYLETNNIPAAISFIENTQDINMTNELGAGLIHVTAEYGSIELVEKLLKSGANSYLRDHHNVTPFLTSVKANHSKLAQWFYSQNNENIKDKDRYGNSALHFSTLNNNIELTEWLIERGIDIHCSNDQGITALHLSCLHSDLKILSKLIQYSSSLQYYKPNLLLYIIEKGSLESLSFILQAHNLKAFDLNKGSVLYKICLRGNPDFLKCAIQHCKDLPINETTYENQTPLGMAAAIGNAKMVKALLDVGANPNIKDQHGNTPLHLVCGYLEYYQIEISHVYSEDMKSDKLVTLQYLLKHSDNINEKNNYFESPLYYAVCTNQYDLVKSLLDSKANRYIKSQNNYSALQAAATYGHTNILKMLIAYGTNDIDDQTEDGWSALHHATANGHIDAVKILLEMNANPLVQDIHYKTPLDIAEQYSLSEIYDLFINYFNENNIKVPTKKISSLEITPLDNYDLSHLKDKNSIRLALIDAIHHNDKVAVVTITKAFPDSPGYANDDQEQSPFAFAIQHGKSSLIEFFLNYNSDFIMQLYDGLNNALHLTANYGYPQLAEFIIKFRPYLIYAKNDKGQTPLHVAILKQHLAIANQIIAADIQIVLPEDGQRPALLNSQDHQGYTALHYAITHGFSELAEKLLYLNVDPNIETHANETAIELAIKHKLLGTVKLLHLFNAKLDLNKFNIDHVMDDHSYANEIKKIISTTSSLSESVIAEKVQQAQLRYLATRKNWLKKFSSWEKWCN